MTENDADRQITQLKAEIEGLRDLLRQRGVQTADNALAASQRTYHQDRKLGTERGRTADAELRADAEGERADRADAQHADLSKVHSELLSSTEFSREILENSTDCIKVLDLDGRLEFMSAGGMRVMEIEDFGQFVGCPWVEFWDGEFAEMAQNAVATAKEGSVARFEGHTPTAKGNMRWWEVIVSPINGFDGRVAKLLSISRDVTTRHDADQRQRILFDEMHHRIKNTLTTVLGIMSQSFRNASNMVEAERSIRDRLVALGTAHNLLIQNQWISANIRDVVTGALTAFIGDSARVTVRGEDLRLSSRAALTIAMLLNELATNAVKYGAWSTDAGAVEISWNVEREGKQFSFRWSEQGGPRVEAPFRRGFGSRLIEQALPADLGGKAALHYPSTGLVFKFIAPVTELTALAPATEEEQ